MSTQRGNISRTRTQKHTNKKAFKNDLHDTSHTIKHINNIEISNVCAHCKGVIEWKIKYKKYKPLKAPSSCVKCHQKNVKHAYHTICSSCAIDSKVCPKCGKSETLVPPAVKSLDDGFLKTSEIKELIKGLPLRRRKTFYRFAYKTIEIGPDELDEDQTVESVILGKLKEMSLCSGKSDSMFDDFDDDFEGSDEGDDDDDDDDDF